MSSLHKGYAFEADYPESLGTRRGSAKLLLMALAEYQGKDPDSFPKHSSLAAHCQCGVRTVRRTIDDLICLGLLTVKLRNADGRQTSNRYIVNWNAVRDLPRVDEVIRAARKSKVIEDIERDGKAEKELKRRREAKASAVKATPIQATGEGGLTDHPNKENGDSSLSEGGLTDHPGDVGWSGSPLRAGLTDQYGVVSEARVEPTQRNPPTTTGAAAGEGATAVGPATAAPFGGATPAVCATAGDGAGEGGSPEAVREAAEVSEPTPGAQACGLLAALTALRLADAGADLGVVLQRSAGESFSVGLAAMLALGIEERKARALDALHSAERVCRGVENTTAAMIDPKVRCKSPAGWCIRWIEQDKPDGPALLDLRKAEADRERAAERSDAILEQQAVSEAEREAEESRMALEHSELSHELQAGGWTLDQACDALAAVYPDDDGRASYVKSARRSGFRMVTNELLRAVIEHLRENVPAPEGVA